MLLVQPCCTACHVTAVLRCVVAGASSECSPCLLLEAVVLRLASLVVAAFTAGSICLSEYRTHALALVCQMRCLSAHYFDTSSSEGPTKQVPRPQQNKKTSICINMHIYIYMCILTCVDCMCWGTHDKGEMAPRKPGIQQVVPPPPRPLPPASSGDKACRTPAMVACISRLLDLYSVAPRMPPCQAELRETHRDLLLAAGC